MERLTRKFETVRARMPLPVVEDNAKAKIGLIGFGSTHPAIQEARERLAVQGVETSYLRLRALPVNGDVLDFIDQYERVYVIEMNTDAQLQKVLQLETPILATRLRSLAFSDGMPLTARWITETILEQEEN